MDSAPKEFHQVHIETDVVATADAVDDAVFIQQPYEAVYVSLRRMRRLSIIVGALSLCFAVLLAFMISRYITRSIAKLTHGVQQVANRNFTVKEFKILKSNFFYSMH